MKEYSIGVIGWGVVGQGIGRLFGDMVKAIFDPMRIPKSNEISNKVNIRMEDFKDLDLAIVCVPTPEAKDGSCDTSIVEETLNWLRGIKFKGVVLIKSTIPPTEAVRFKGTSGLRIVFSPEFMGESKYFTPYWKYPDPTDMRTHMWQVFGGVRRNTSFCIDVFKRKMSVDTQYFQTDIVTASLAKYIENGFFASKVTFVNEWYDIAYTYGVDWNELRELWLIDPRINRNHTLVFPRDRGYGGKCFPKDVKAIIKDAERLGYSPELLKSVDKVNKEIREKNEK